MSERDNFAGGFLVGTIVGGAIGGVLGVLLASRYVGGSPPVSELRSSSNLPDGRSEKGKKRSLATASQPEIEVARRGLEDKIAQLNDAIDEVRQQLSGVHNSGLEPRRSPSLEGGGSAIAPEEL
ncbi:hypothetical protein DO97_07380 [Neosynechococcus sphagnicola sy1]|uniref:Gas vesicle protein n=1 Tax=Neosynechococcus sphagnicola sy1 TaxID=1497020 RepID=A0A098TK02_9CYAN|nr:hypothetical protein [Neosynechococcus sphagnicola]KGF72596.1 hypothetical protein DO97_07380 [Neosynechococcus sphagnicola sy1]